MKKKLAKKWYINEEGKNEKTSPFHCSLRLTLVTFNVFFYLFFIFWRIWQNDEFFACCTEKSLLNNQIKIVIAKFQSKIRQQTS